MITEIKVTYASGIKSEEFGPITKAEVGLTAVVPDDISPEDALDQVSWLAMKKVALMLGKTPKDLPSGLAAGELKANITTAPTEEPTVPKPRVRTPPKGAAAMIVDEPKAAAPVKEEASASSAPETKAPVVEEEDEWGASAAPAPEITDPELTAACTLAATEKGVNPVDVRSLIASFSPDPTVAFKLVQIPQAQRQDFLTKLRALYK